MDRASGAVRMAAFVPLFIATMFGSPPATAGKPSIKEIQELINKGQYYFEEERFEEALENYEKAHEASGQHLLLFMIARCHQRLDHTRDALETFRAFLARPDIPEGPRGKAEMAVQVLEEELERGTIVIQVTPVWSRGSSRRRAFGERSGGSARDASGNARDRRQGGGIRACPSRREPGPGGRGSRGGRTPAAERIAPRAATRKQRAGRRTALLPLELGRRWRRRRRRHRGRGDLGRGLP